MKMANAVFLLDWSIAGLTVEFLYGLSNVISLHVAFAAFSGRTVVCLGA